MDERDANIDLVFRNGFRTLEVLPPPEVWDNIQPAIRKKQRSVILFWRAAAAAAVILSVSVSVNRWNSESVAENQMPVNQNFIPLIEAVPDNENNLTAFNNDQLLPGNESVSDVSDNLIERDEIFISKISFEPVKSDLGAPVINESIENPFNKKINIAASPNLYLADPYRDILSDSKPVKIVDRWSITAMASPTYFSQFKFGKDQFARQMMESEQPLMSYSGGLALSYKISKRVSVQSGVFYSSVGQQIDGISSFGGFRKYDNTKGSRNFEVITSSGVVFTSNEDVFLTDNASSRVIAQPSGETFDPEKANLQYLNNSLKQNYSYLELPVFLRYKVIDKALDVNVIGGLSYNFLVNNSVYTMNEGNRYSIGKTDGLSIMTFSSSFGMGMEYAFTKNISLNLEPTFRYYLNPFKNIDGADIHPYSFGVFSGISFRF